MKYLLVPMAGLCFFFVSLSAMVAPAADEAAIRTVMEKRKAAFNAKDAQAYAVLHVESFENWLGTVKDRAAFEKDRSERFERQKNEKRELLNEIGIVFVTPEVAIYKGRMEYAGWVDADGKIAPPGKRLLARVLVKKQGQWLIAATFGRSIEE